MVTKKDEKNYISREVLRERVKKSTAKADIIKVTLPKGTIDIIKELTEDKPSSFCKEIILKTIKELSKKD